MSGRLHDPPDAWPDLDHACSLKFNCWGGSASGSLPKADVELIVLTVFDQISSALARGQRVELRGFGAFTVKRRNARVGRNPRTGEGVPVDEKEVPFFRASRALRDRVNRRR